MNTDDTDKKGQFFSEYIAHEALFDQCYQCESVVNAVFVQSTNGVTISKMYSRQIKVRYNTGAETLACPIKWLDSFSMRSFTNDSIFDDTLPVADGLMRVGTRVPLDRLKEAMEDWFHRKSYLSKEQRLLVEEAS
jgi:hypothetical protein